MIYIFDIDGTIADLSHRLHFIQSDPKDWDGFFAACVDDAPIESVMWLARDLSESGHIIILISGRSDAVRDPTSAWLARNEMPFDCLYMRKAGDHRPDYIVKSELLDETAKNWNLKQVAVIFEDRKQVVDMYRKRGFTVFQVADGDF